MILPFAPASSTIVSFLFWLKSSDLLSIIVPSLAPGITKLVMWSSEEFLDLRWLSNQRPWLTLRMVTFTDFPFEVGPRLKDICSLPFVHLRWSLTLCFYKGHQNTNLLSLHTYQGWVCLFCFSSVVWVLLLTRILGKMFMSFLFVSSSDVMFIFFCNCNIALFILFNSSSLNVNRAFDYLSSSFKCDNSRLISQNFVICYQ